MLNPARLQPRQNATFHPPAHCFLLFLQCNCGYSASVLLSSFWLDAIVDKF